jgi:hypothetical protein
MQTVLKGTALLSITSKMPCKSFSTSPTRCITGAKLAKVPGSVCHGCYALKGNYQFKNVKQAHERRYQFMIQSPGDWEDAMVEAIGKQKYFRWHDSGDVQSVGLLLALFRVCERTPKTKHWLPSREYKFIERALNVQECPTNLVIRASAHMIDAAPPRGFSNTSTVHKDAEPHGKACHAYTRGGECGLCRACWNPNVANVSYPKH